MAQWFRAVAALPEDLDSIPSAHTSAYCSSRGCDALFCPLWALGTQVIPRHIYREKTHTHMYSFFFFYKLKRKCVHVCMCNMGIWRSEFNFCELSSPSSVGPRDGIRFSGCSQWFSPLSYNTGPAWDLLIRLGWLLYVFLILFYSLLLFLVGERNQKPKTSGLWT